MLKFRVLGIQTGDDTEESNAYRRVDALTVSQAWPASDYCRRVCELKSNYQGNDRTVTLRHRRKSKFTPASAICIKLGTWDLLVSSILMKRRRGASTRQHASYFSPELSGPDTRAESGFGWLAQCPAQSASRSRSSFVPASYGRNDEESSRLTAKAPTGKETRMGMAARRPPARTPSSKSVAAH